MGTEGQESKTARRPLKEVTNFMKPVSKLLSAALAVSLLTPALTLAQAKTPQPAAAKSAPAATADVKAPVAVAPTEKEIADAKAKGLVWADTKNGVFFKRGHSFGKTTEGKFMTEADAKAAGYHGAGQTGKHHKETK